MASLLRAAALAAGLVLAATMSPVRAASTSDCTAPGWGGTSLPHADYACVEVSRRTWEQSDAVVRVVRDGEIPEELAQKYAAVVLDAAMHSLGVFNGQQPTKRIWNLTFMLHTRGQADGGRVEQVGLDFECLVQINVKNPTGGGSSKGGQVIDKNEYAFLVAHEIVHCLQYWWAQKQMTASGRSNGAWWFEGSADFIASIAYAPGQRFRTWVGEFDAESAQTPLTQMTYETYVFFCWYAQQKGVPAVFELWYQMPTAPGEQLQRDALLALVGAEGLQQFARDYIDGKIRGFRSEFEIVGKGPLGAPTYFTASAEALGTGEPFTVMRGEVIFRGGRYAVEVIETGEPVPAPFSSNWGVWSTLPDEVDASCAQPIPYRYALVPLGADLHQLVIAAKQEEKDENCPSCAVMPERTACIVGRWKVDTDAMQEMLLDEEGICGASTKGGIEIEFAKNGTATYIFEDLGTMTAPCTAQTGIGTTVTVETKGFTQGTWSSTPTGRMQYCPISSDVMHTSTVTMVFPEKRDLDTQTFPGPVDPQTFVYTCQGDTLTIVAEGANLPSGTEVNWVLRRAELVKLP